MSPPTLADRLATFAVAAMRDGIPPDVQASVRQRVLDIVGLCCAALPLRTSRAAIDHALAQGGVARSTLVGHPQGVPPAQAAFVNGVLAHSLDYDDTHLPSILHPSASVVPAALAVGEGVGASGRQVLAAAAVGIEVCVRLGMAGYDPEAGNSLFFERGQHATSICGGLASAVTAALLLGADETGVRDAIAVAASMSSGIIEANRTGGTVKRLHCGWAAQAGVTAAELVERGFTGPPTVLEGRFGFYAAWLAGHFRPDEITDGLGQRWAVPDICFKPYPANHFTHAGIDAALRLRASGLDPAMVEHVVLEVAAPTVRTIGEPVPAKRRPESGYHAKFSGPYTVAAALLGGGGLGLALADFSDAAVHRPEVLALMDRIEVAAAPDLLDRYPQQLPARLTVHTRDGARLVEEVLVNRGGPQHPLSDGELATKFEDNTRVMFDAETVKELRRRLEALDTTADVRGLLAPAAQG